MGCLLEQKFTSTSRFDSCRTYPSGYIPIEDGKFERIISQIKKEYHDKKIPNSSASLYLVEEGIIEIPFSETFFCVMHEIEAGIYNLENKILTLVN